MGNMLNIKTLLEALNPSRKMLSWFVATAVAAIPVAWVLSGDISAKKVMDDTRLNTLESSISALRSDVAGLYVRIDSAEQIVTAKHETSLNRISFIIKESDRTQTNQLKFVINNWSEQNKLLINEALDLRQTQSEAKIDALMDEAITASDPRPPYIGEPEVVAVDSNGNYIVESIDNNTLNDIKRKYKILSVKPNADGSYNVVYRYYTAKERTEIEYFE